MGKSPVTQAQWRAVATLPQRNQDLDPDPSRFKGENRPVENVSWHDAIEFCARLSVQTGRQYGLPTEAEWEYACRAGTTTPFCFGETITTELANYDGDYVYNKGPKGVKRGKTTPIASFPANAFGLYDMHGNVWEWCADPWHNSYAENQRRSSKMGIVLGDRRMRMIIGRCGVVPGSTLRGFAVLRFATSLIRTGATTTTASVFGLSVVPRGLLSSPLHYSTFALFTLFFSLPFGAERPEIVEWMSGGVEGSMSDMGDMGGHPTPLAFTSPIDPSTPPLP